MEDPRVIKTKEFAASMCELFGKDFTAAGFNLYLSGLLDIFRDVVFDHKQYGEINDIAWITKETLKEFSRFPSVKEIRDIYREYLYPRDMLPMKLLPLDAKPELKRDRTK